MEHFHRHEPPGDIGDLTKRNRSRHKIVGTFGEGMIMVKNMDMSEEELKEILKEMEEQGFEPMLCDTPIPCFDNEVMCGSPADIGDIVKKIGLMPAELLAWEPGFVMKARGDSMKDANILEGDLIRIEVTDRFHDGDIVLARIDGDFILKSYCEDDDGIPWLVPHNENYDAFPLTEEQDVWLIGVAKGIIKQAPRMNYRSCKKLISKAREKRQDATEIPQLQISRIIREIAPTITVARQWYAVFRAMVDMDVVGEEDFEAFCTMIQTEVPEHPHLPVRDEIQRMAIMSFAKPVSLWNPDNAPVQGKRFNDYLRTAKQTKRILGNK